MLFEPTNITPSTLTFTGTVASGDTINIQWQVNGNSAMTAFQIDVYQNDAYSTFVHSTGVISDGCPFNGKNSKGEYVTFTYVPFDTSTHNVVSWGNWGLQNGASYKYKITQFFAANNKVVSKSIGTNLSANGKYYFTFADGDATQYLYFAVADASIFLSGSMVNYSITNGKGWVLTSTNRVVPITVGLTSSAPSGYTQLDGDAAVVNAAYGQDFTAQNSFSAIILRSRPSLTFNSTITKISTSSQNFSASYSQAQGDNIRWVRWQLAELTSDYVGGSPTNAQLTMLDDTGEVATFVLQYSYSGFVNERYYAIRCTIETENGVQASTGWATFNVEYAENTYTGTFNVECIRRDDCVLLSWDSISVFPADVLPAENGYTAQDGLLTLESDATVTWSQRFVAGDVPEPISFSTPWTITWNGQIFDMITQVGELSQIREQPVVNKAAFSDDGSYLFVCGGTDDTPGIGYVSMYSISETANVLMYPNIIQTPSGNYNTLSVSLSNLFVGAKNAGSYLYYLPSGVPAFLQEITFPSGKSIPCECGMFSPNGDLLLIGTSVTDEAYSYAIAFSFLSVGGGARPTLGGAIAIDGLTATVRHVAFSPNESLAVFVGDFPEKIKLYSVSNGVFTFSSNIQINGSVPDIHVNSLSFSPDGTRLLLAGYRESVGETAGVASVFSVNETTVTYLYDLPIDGQTTFVGAVTEVAYNKDGTLIAVSGLEGNKIEILYNPPESTTADSTMALQTIDVSVAETGLVNSVAFNPLSTNIVAIGSFVEKGVQYRVRENSKVFSVNATDTENAITVQRIGKKISIQQGATELASTQMDDRADQIVYALTPNALAVLQFANGVLLNTDGAQELNLAYSQPTIESVTLYGYQLCNSFVVYDGDGLDILPLLTNPDFRPTRQNGDYTVDLLADFVNGLEGGTSTSVGEGFHIYRTESGSNALKEIVSVPATVTEVKDYGIKSGRTYQYYFYAYDANGAFMGVIESAPLTTAFEQYTLLATEYRETDGCYHVVKSYRFYANISAMSVANNNTPEFALNYTRYPTKFRSSANYASGTLEGLIGDVNVAYEEYYDDAALITELNELSTSDYTLFLKDMKGFLRLVTVSGAITQTSAINTREQQTSISLPWTEIGDAGSVSVIQTPEDDGWDYDDMVLEVSLDVDVYSGVLSAYYPPAYYGTTFHMPNERDLDATTPCGITPADLYISPIAEESDDGELVATILRDKTD